jgi:hypothetical protein
MDILKRSFLNLFFEITLQPTAAARTLMLCFCRYCEPNKIKLHDIDERPANRRRSRSLVHAKPIVLNSVAEEDLSLRSSSSESRISPTSGSRSQ